MSAGATLRTAEPRDLDALADNVAEGFDTYRSFARPGWEPPARDRMRDEFAELLPESYFWCLVAEVDGEPAGHVAFLPAARSRLPTAEPGLAHLLNLFVRAPHRGTGLAPRLLERAVDEMRARDFTSARLFTPAGQARARRFYEREGWAPAGEPEMSEGLGFELIEYRRDVA